MTSKGEELNITL